MQHHTLVFGSSLWCWSLFLTLLYSAVILFYAKKNSFEANEKLRLYLAIFFFLVFISFQVYALFDGSWSRQSSLPFHLCAFSQILGVYALFTKNQFAFEFSCFFGIAGGLNSLLTPEFAHGYDKFYHVQYYFEHSGIVLMPIFLGIAYQMKPRKLSWLSIMITANILTVIMYFFNKANQSNYMYVNTKPIANNPLLIGDWPYYILVLEIVAIIHFYIIYIAFHGFKRWV